jgi:hypothetical protein
MSDIVERLRVQDEHGIFDLPEGHEFVSYGDAADYIEWLRRRDEILSQTLKDANDWGLELYAENEQLREALKENENA